jgi:hypothetical protein
MVHRRGKLRLPAKTREGALIVGQCWGKELQRHETVEASILRPVDDAHPAPAQFVENAVVRDRLADHQVEILGIRGSPSQLRQTANPQMPTNLLLYFLYSDSRSSVGPLARPGETDSPLLS